MNFKKLYSKINIFFNAVASIFLLARFPWLAPRRYKDDSIAIDKWYKSWTMLEEMPVGWKKSFGIRMCKEIDKILRREDHLKDYRVFQIKEKFGELRWYDNYNNKELSEIKEKYRKLSMHTCIKCGKKADYMSKGWISPWCHQCAYDSYFKQKSQNKNFDVYFSSIDEFWKEWNEE